MAINLELCRKLQAIIVKTHQGRCGDEGAADSPQSTT